jgi:hypothetical protein
MFARCAAYIGDRASLTEERLPGINTIVMDEELTAAIGQAAKVSMGMDASPLDMSNVVTFTERMVKLAEYRKVGSYTFELFLTSFSVHLYPETALVSCSTTACAALNCTFHS